MELKLTIFKKYIFKQGYCGQIPKTLLEITHLAYYKLVRWLATQDYTDTHTQTEIQVHKHHRQTSQLSHFGHETNNFRVNHMTKTNPHNFSQ